VKPVKRDQDELLDEELPLEDDPLSREGPERLVDREDERLRRLVAILLGRDSSSRQGDLESEEERRFRPMPIA
jgi:hypothetical protein